MNKTIYTVLAILVIAAVTLAIRSSPYLLFGGKRRIPKTVHYLGKVLPPAIIILLIIFCIKDTEFLSYPYGLPEFISIAVIIGLQKWKKNDILSVIVGTACYMLLIRLF